jgi:hypothetical protein
MTTVSESMGADRELPDFPRTRSKECPFAPPPELLRVQSVAPVTRVRNWDGKSVWAGQR